MKVDMVGRQRSHFRFGLLFSVACSISCGNTSEQQPTGSAGQGGGGSGGTSNDAGTGAGADDAGRGGSVSATGGTQSIGGTGGSGGTGGLIPLAGAAGSSAGSAGTDPCGTVDPQLGLGGTSGFTEILTRSYDNQRTNLSRAETILNTSNVNSAQFGKLFELPVDDQVYAQILYVSGLSIAGGTHNVIYVATLNNSVYAFDADAPAQPLWQRNFNGAGRPTKNYEIGQACGSYKDFSDNIGIVGTPVIDRAAQTMYFVTRTVEGTFPNTMQRLRAIDIVTGNDRTPGEVVIQPIVSGKIFNPLTQNQRMSLGLSQGVVYVGWAAFCDTGPYHGWMAAYDATTLAQVGALNTSPGSSQSGIWMGGSGPMFDGTGKLYVATGNGSYDGYTNFGESVLKLEPKTLKVLDHFAPSNYSSLNGRDWDLGSAGPTLLPGTNRFVQAGKEGRLYLLETCSLGHMFGGDTQIPQSFQIVDPVARPTESHHLHNGVAVWESPAGLNLYAAGENDYLRAFRFNRSKAIFDLPAAAVSNVLPPEGMPGGMLTISANGSKAGSGIVWATTPRTGNANNDVRPGILRAYNAENLALLWDSTNIADDTYDFAKFNNPTVMSGKVYVASFSKLISVYGPRSVAPVITNLALNKAATGSAPCDGTKGPEKAVNGSVGGGDADKFCTKVDGRFLQVDLGAPTPINRIIIRHAGTGGEPSSWNTSDFVLQVSTDNVNFTDIDKVVGNTASTTVHTFGVTEAQWVRLNISKPTRDGNASARIYELEVYGPSAGQ